MEITDRMIDGFYGEYERPSFCKTRSRRTLTCWNCGEEIYPGEEYTQLPQWDDNAGEIICSECAECIEVLESAFLSLGTDGMRELLDMTMEVYDG